LLISRKIENGPELIERFNRGMRRLKESGLHEQYISESLRGEYLPGK